jgi:HK97 family phage major capsid protein
LASLTIEEREARLNEIQARLEEIDVEYSGEALPEEFREEWNRLRDEQKEQEDTVAELRKRQEQVAENGASQSHREEGAHFNVGFRKTNSDIYDLTQIRVGMDNPQGGAEQLRDNALRAIERAHYPSMDAQTAQTNVEHVLNKAEDANGTLSRRLLLTGSPTYARAWQKYMTGQRFTSEEERVMSLTTNSGGFGVPFQLDPTIILSSDGGINPFRQIARIEQINVDTWQGVSSAGVTASFDSELAEVSDDSMTLAQPTVSTEMARAYVPFSIEVGMDYPGFANEVAKAISDSKDVLEASQFATGTTPQGIITGATGLVTASTRGSITSSDVYAIEAALPPRFLQRASWVASRAALQKFRQFDTAGGAQLWIQNLQYGLGRGGQGSLGGPTDGRVGYALLGWNAYASSGITSTLTTGTKPAVLGDFSNFLIADRVGLSVEYVPHLLSTGGPFPRGGRAYFAYWRTGSGVLVTNAFRTFIL